MTSTMKPAKRILCVLLAFLMVFTACFMPMAKAAVVETLIAKYGVEILATILVGSGIGFASSDGARAAAAGCWDWMSTNATSAWNTIKAWSIKALENPGIVSNSGVRMTTSLWNAVESAVSSWRATDGSFVASGAETVVVANLPTASDDLVSICNYMPRYSSFSISDGDVFWYITDDGDRYTLRRKTISLNRVEGKDYLEKQSDALENVGIYGFYAEKGKIVVLFGQKYRYIDVNGDLVTSSRTGRAIVLSDLVDTLDVVWNDIPIPSTGDLVYPSDNYLVKMPDIPSVDVGEDGSEVVLYPDLSLNPADHLADIPKADVATGELLDVPMDVLVDVGTGELVQTGEGTGEGTDTGLWDWLKSLLKSILDAIKSILAAIVGFFDTPADFRLDFDGFKNMRLPTRFPFCIPFDFVNAIRVFARNAQDFQFRIDLETSYFQIHHVVDLTPFILPIAFFRYTACIWFGLVLINKTRDLIKW